MLAAPSLRAEVSISPAHDTAATLNGWNSLDTWAKRTALHAWLDGLVDDLTNRAKQPESYSEIIYTIQIQTNLLASFAFEHKDEYILDRLARLYAVPFEHLRWTDNYLFYTGGIFTSNGYEQRPLPLAEPMWLDDNGRERILTAAQFLYLISYFIDETLRLPAVSRSAAMQRLAELYIPILRSHYQRWIFSDGGPFQVAGWGCADGLFNHSAFLRALLDRRFGGGPRVSPSPSYCNAVTDTDLWIIAGVVELLAAQDVDPTAVGLSANEIAAYAKHAALGIDLIRSRSAATELRTPGGAHVVGLTFDPKAWRDHPDMRYAGYSDSEFPVNGSPHASETQDLHQSAVEAKPSRSAAPGTGSWDISHGRRLVQVFGTLHKHRELTGSPWPDEETLRQLARQVTFAVFNGDLDEPGFRNFLDGSDGWYRVNYAGRLGFGYAPGQLASTFINSGYCSWSDREPALQQLCSRLWDLLRTHGIAHEHFQNCFMNLFQPVACTDLELRAMNMIATFPQVLEE